MRDPNRTCSVRLLSLGVLIILGVAAPVFSDPSEKMDFWRNQRKGANGSLHQFRPEWFEAASAVGIEFIRFFPDRLPAADGRFLIGGAEHFSALNETDVALLERALDEAHAHDLKVVLVMLSLPGRIARPFNNDEHDYRIWQDATVQNRAVEFWRQVALRVRNHPAVVGYNLLNEPHPALFYGHEEPTDEFLDWLETTRGTLTDINRFNRRMVAAIREVDSDTPIILNGYFYAAAAGMAFLDAVDDPNTLYAFHNIAPWQFAAYRANRGRYVYPDRMPEYWDAPGTRWTFRDLASRVEPVLDFASKHAIPAHRIMAAEFWCDRRVSGCREYLADAIRLYNANGWHWAFYDFRSDGAWGGLDYELGTDPTTERAIWAAEERGEDPERYKDRHDNPLWEVIRREFR